MSALESTRFVEQARAATGLEDFGDDEFGADWRQAMERLLEALTREAALNELGVAVVEGEMVSYLSSRLGVVAERTARPEIASTDVVAPIVIVGQSRTGTTILHDLLAQDPASRVPLSWEVDYPCPPPETATYFTDPRIDTVDQTLAGFDLLLPGFRTMHPMGARLPQECVRITALDFHSMIFPTQYRVPSYARWLLHDCDMTSAYHLHRAFLQHLQSRHPTDRWVLKSPGHIWCLGALLAEYPDALLVQTHRDPLRIVASVSSVVAKLRSLASDDTSIPDAANEFTDYIIDGLDWSIDARQDGTVHPDRVVDLQFASFIRDPLATVRVIYERLGLELDDTTASRMRKFMDEHPPDLYGKHVYSFRDTGLDEAELRARVRRYQDHFDVPSEPLA